MSSPCVHKRPCHTGTFTEMAEQRGSRQTLRHTQSSTASRHLPSDPASSAAATAAPSSSASSAAARTTTASLATTDTTTRSSAPAVGRTLAATPWESTDSSRLSRPAWTPSEMTIHRLRDMLSFTFSAFCLVCELVGGLPDGATALKRPGLSPTLIAPCESP